MPADEAGAALANADADADGMEASGVGRGLVMMRTGTIAGAVVVVGGANDVDVLIAVALITAEGALAAFFKRHTHALSVLDRKLFCLENSACVSPLFCHASTRSDHFNQHACCVITTPIYLKIEVWLLEF